MKQFRPRKLYKDYQSLNPNKNPFAFLLAKLSGVARPPKTRQGYQQFMRESWRDVIEPEVKRRWAEKVKSEGLDPDKAPGHGFRTSVAIEMFKQLPKSEQDAVKRRAQVEGQAARKAYQDRLAAPLLKTPEFRQWAMEALPYFVLPILEGLRQRTGQEFTLIYGGPSNGELYADSISSRGFSENRKTWAGSDETRFNREVLASFKDFLKVSYTDEEIKATQGLSSAAKDGDPPVFDGYDDDEDNWSDTTDDDDDEPEQIVPPPKKRQKKAATSAKPKAPAARSISRPKGRTARAGPSRPAKPSPRSNSIDVDTQMEDGPLVVPERAAQLTSVVNWSTSIPPLSNASPFPGPASFRLTSPPELHSPMS